MLVGFLPIFLTSCECMCVCTLGRCGPSHLVFIAGVVCTYVHAQLTRTCVCLDSSLTSVRGWWGVEDG